MIIKCMQKANELVTPLIRDLESLVNAHDHINIQCSLDYSLNVDSTGNNLFLAFEEGQLVGVLSVFMPSDNEAEILAFTHPDHRQKGVFRSLLKVVSESLVNHNPLSLLFVCDSKSLTGLKTMKALNAAYDFSEYTLSRKNSDLEIATIPNPIFAVRAARPSEATTLANVRSSAFGESLEESTKRIDQAFSLSHRTQYVAILEDKIIGIATSSIEALTTFIVGFGILPEYQGKGYGKQFLSRLISLLHHQGHAHLTLEVDSLNAPAFKLYQSCGFKVIASVDYYRYSLTQS